MNTDLMTDNDVSIQISNVVYMVQELDTLEVNHDRLIELRDKVLKLSTSNEELESIKHELFDTLNIDVLDLDTRIAIHSKLEAECEDLTAIRDAIIKIISMFIDMLKVIIGYTTQMTLNLKKLTSSGGKFANPTNEMITSFDETVYPFYTINELNSAIAAFSTVNLLADINPNSASLEEAMSNLRIDKELAMFGYDISGDVIGRIPSAKRTGERMHDLGYSLSSFIKLIRDTAAFMKQRTVSSKRQIKDLQRLAKMASKAGAPLEAGIERSKLEYAMRISGILKHITESIARDIIEIANKV